MTIPWIKNRESKLKEKQDKYVNIIQSTKVVLQSTFIVDCLGGYSNDLVDNLTEIGFTRKEIDDILPGIQKIAVTEANALVNRFKVVVME